MGNGMEIVPLSEAMGAEIRGIDLRQPQDAAMVAAINDAWHEHIVLLFRGQALGLEEHTQFAGYFGEIGKHMRPKAIRNEAAELGPNVMLVSNIRENGKPIGSLPDGEMMFHSDTPYREQPDKATMLFAMEVPSVGGHTIFANSYLAAETLPEDVKRRLAGREAVHVFEYGAVTKSGKFDRESAPHFAQPVFRKHPVTGRTALYVSELMTEEIVGLPDAESRELLDFLFAHQSQAQFCYEHVWQPDDLLIWDNRCSIHARTDFPSTERRKLRRLTVIDENPVMMGDPPGQTEVAAE
jgi:taurine dioxygenase